ncbi:guanylate-binding protein 2 [Strongylocentrotus purpuratus]|uniref:GB1/RHD3-type G domain-containing protein n=1 Tax=Strongylocentrotus purpuratus TaxID=7668 RepID=A0A7M7T4U5_STRPU|nr:guanylate-binding protein 2 [Strongylocentrotus purpuratus]
MFLNPAYLIICYICIHRGASEQVQSVHDVKQTLPLPSQDHGFPKSSEREKQINETTRDPPERPLQLVRPDATHKKLELVQENIQYLLKMDQAVAVVAVVGKYHSGKSFLLNQLMGKQTQLGFRVGPYLRPETMGIWMWGKPTRMTLSSGQDVAVIFLDTEGFAANNVSETYDAKVFAVSALLSSYLIYNSVKVIDQADLDYLELLARRTQLFALRSQLSRAKWAQDFNHDLLSFPPLLWVVQDFVQSLDSDDTASDPKKWLHHMMQSMAWEGEDHPISLMDVFQSVDCRTLFFPATTKEILQDLSKAKESDLTIDYRQERDELIKGLKAGLVPKEKNGKLLGGPEMASLLNVLVTAANEGSLSQIPSRWSSFIQSLEQSAVEDCLKFYEADMSILLGIHDNGPINTEELKAWQDQALGKSLKLLHQVLFGLHGILDGASNSLEEQLRTRAEQVQDLNDKKIRLACSEIQHRCELEVEAALSQLELPMRSQDFTQTFHSIRNQASHSFENQLARFNTSNHFRDHLSKLHNSLQKMKDSSTLKNTRALENVLLVAREKALGLYRETTINPDPEPLTPKELDRQNKLGEEKAVELFINEASLAVDEPGYKLHSAALKSEMKDEEEKCRMKNENLLKAACHRKILEVMEHIKESTDSNHVVLPLNETDLTDRLTTALDRAKAMYQDAMHDFISSQVYHSGVMELDRRLQALCAQRRQDNVEAYSREVEAPLKVAKQVSLLSVDNYETVFSTTRFIRKVCLLNLNEGKPKNWPSDLKASIIDLFIQSDPDLQRVIRSRQGFWSSLIGFFQWIMSLFR